MLTPMMVQYLVGLCCLQHDADAIDITLGNMIYDTAAGKKRDVDVTITNKNASGSIEAFKAAEVKAESRPLDIVAIEQLCIKMADMPNVTHKSIFSTSGYTDGAQSKAKAHSVDLYTLMHSDKPFSAFADRISFRENALLYWIDYNVTPVVPTAPVPIYYQNNTPIFTGSNKSHPIFLDMRNFIDNILYRSTCILSQQDPVITNLFEFSDSRSLLDADYLEGPAWPHTDTIDVTCDEVYLKHEDELFRIDEVTITGSLQRRMRKLKPEFFVLRNVFNQKIFAGAAITDYGTDDGRMFAMVFPSETELTVGIHQICIPEKQRNIIRNLKIKFGNPFI